ncbi:UPF0016-domain-containing protein [Acaromyces ingoldii]|uniref:GDT1 family protein n=1 Tax=Acaromyces ingoldii TaxID=215250 RepID=A0A316YHK3_9BASI|nr:UPF0016-domain-containing protein [Acaromyces ingoldii]PWN88679.1 UPF0016-domain-containing protein [Acaromyces ingoldii]
MDTVQPVDAGAGQSRAYLSLVSAVIGAWQRDPRAVWSSFSMIIVSEIGDKTFLIAAILSMRQSRPVVFLGAFAALAVMSVLSALMGVMFPALLPRSLTTFAAAVLFGVFGARMLLDGLKMTGDELGEEWDEAQKEVDEEEVAMDGGGSAGAAGGMEMLRMEEGAGQGANGYPNVLPYPPTPSPAVQSSPSSSTPGPKSSSAYNFKDGARNLCMLCFSPVFAQAFVLTFLGEWGDRSQIATIALAAAHDIFLVSFGTIAGHALCTSLAVLGGRWLASRISVKHVTLGGAILFLLFGILYLIESFAEFRNPAPLPPSL